MDQDKNVQEQEYEILKRILKYTPVGILVFQQQEDLTYAISRTNQYARELFGESKEFLATCKMDYFIDCLHPQETITIPKKMEKGLQSKGVQVVKCRLRKKGTSDYTWVRMTGRLIITKGAPRVLYFALADITEEVQADLDNLRNQQILQSAVEGANLSTFEYNPKDKSIFILPNAHFRQIHVEYDMPQYIENVPESLRPFIEEKSYEQMEEAYRKLDQGAKEVSFEIWYKEKKKSSYSRACEKITYRRIEDNEQGSKILGVAQDVTAAKLQEESYKKLQHEVVNINANTKLVFVIDVTKDHCALTYDDTNRDVFRDLDTIESLNDIMKKLLDKRSYEKFEARMNQESLRNLYVSGITKFSLDLIMVNEKDHKHYITVSVNMAYDLEERRLQAVVGVVDRHKEILREKLLSQIASQRFTAIALIGAKSGRIRYYFGENRHLGTTYEGVKYDELARKLVEKIVPEKERESLCSRVELKTVLDNLKENSEYCVDAMARKHTGEKAQMHSSFSYLDEDKSYIVLLQMDMTKSYQKEMKIKEELSKALTKAERSLEEKSNFLSAMSHDMRTPLNGMIGFTDLALALDCSPKMKQYLQKVRSSSALLMDLVNDTLDISKAESGTMKIEKEKVDFPQFFKELYDALKTSADLKEIHFTLDNQASSLKSAYADRVKVQKILLNILSNAIKFTPKGGRVSLRVEEASRPNQPYRYRMVVTDNGRGIDKKFLPHIFEAFSQEKNALLYETQGTGLGLSIVKRYVDFLEGEVYVDSEKGKGSTFQVFLSFPPAEGSQTEEIEEVDLSVLEGKKVLLCEDNKINQELAKRILEMKSVTTDWAKDGQEGYEKFLLAQPGEYVAILMDIRMPVCDGYEACRMIRSSDRPLAHKIPIIAMTADAYPEDIEKCLEAGMNAHIAKPIIPNVLYKTLAKAIISAKE